MNLSALVTGAGSMPHNLYHILLDNETYAVTGGQPTPGAGVVSFTGMSLAVGYNAAFDFDDLEDLVTRIDEVLGHKGHVWRPSRPFRWLTLCLCLSAAPGAGPPKLCR